MAKQGSSNTDLVYDSVSDSDDSVHCLQELEWKLIKFALFFFENLERKVLNYSIQRCL
jgi:hypothetical protein